MRQFSCKLGIRSQGLYLVLVLLPMFGFLLFGGYTFEEP